MIETSFNRTIRIIRSDNAQEYNDKFFLSFLDNKGTLPPPVLSLYLLTKWSSKHKHCHILDVVRTLFISASLPERFWSEAALTAVYTINHVPSPATHNKLPFELLYGQTPNYSSLQVFGYTCFVSLPPHERTKLQPRARLTSIRYLIVVAAICRWPFYQMDVKNAFLNGDLQGEVYTQPLPGYTHSGHQVCRLRRALYGLK